MLRLQLAQNFRGTDDGLLDHLRADLGEAKPDIDNYVREILRNPHNLATIGNDIHINGEPLRTYFDHDTFFSIINCLRSARNIMSEFSDFLKDIVSILCLAANICENLVGYFRGNNAEERWREIIREAGLLTDEMTATYEQHKAIYNDIFNQINKLLPDDIKFCIRVIAAIVSGLWPYRHAIASWIVANWKTISTGALIVGGLAALAALGIGAVYAVSKMGEQKEDQRRRRHHQ